MNSTAIKVEAGKTYWCCRCGRSRHPPFCDGTHKGSEFFPLKYTAVETGEIRVCGCGQTASPPVCDGNHDCTAPSDDG